MKHFGPNKLFLFGLVIVGILGYQNCGDPQGGAPISPSSKTLKSADDAIVSEDEMDASTDIGESTPVVPTTETLETTDEVNDNPPMEPQPPVLSGPPVAPGHEWYPETGVCKVTLRSKRGAYSPRVVLNNDAVGLDNHVANRSFKLRQKDLKQGRTFRTECTARAQKFFNEYCEFILGYEDSRTVKVYLGYDHMPEAKCQPTPSGSQTVCGSVFSRHLILSGTKARRKCSKNNQVSLPEFRSDAIAPD